MGNLRQQQDDSYQEGELTSLSKQFEQAQAAASMKMAGFPMPFPPPQLSTPLPAPAPQRVKSNLPEQYATSSRSETPEITPSSAAAQPPPTAPWAKDMGSESHRGPSLKEIQDAEAKKAAKAEEAAASVRRAMVEQEVAREREKAAIIASGLPTTSTWGTASPVSLGAASSPWTKPVAVKTPAPGVPALASVSDKKKTLADIQREEEARKAKARDIAAQSGAAASAGKRYADLASKPNATPVPGAAASPVAGWATVGAGGKVKIPTGPASLSRSVSSTGIKVAVAPTIAKPVVKSASVTTTTARTEAMDEFNKWLQGQLTRGITGVNDSK
jgi:PERQ amino acid-rich with GYF domain-containing protein